MKLVDSRIPGPRRIVCLTEATTASRSSRRSHWAKTASLPATLTDGVARLHRIIVDWSRNITAPRTMGGASPLAAAEPM